MREDAMLWPRYLSWLDRLRASNRLYGTVVVSQVVLNVVLGFVILRLQHHAQVVVIPLGSGDGLQVGHGRASEPYLRRMARYVVSQAGTYTAATARDQLFEILDLFPPEAMGAAQASFEQAAGEIERFPSIASVVRWSGQEPLRYDRQMLQVQVRKARLVNGSETESKTVHYCLRYRIDDTRFQLINLMEKEDAGEDPCFRGG
jgi:conjugal transfer pilus assembly protein TraE